MWLSKSKLPHAIFSIGLFVWSTHMWMFNLHGTRLPVTRWWRIHLERVLETIECTMCLTMVTRFWHHISISSIVFLSWFLLRILCGVSVVWKKKLETYSVTVSRKGKRNTRGLKVKKKSLFMNFVKLFGWILQENMSESHFTPKSRGKKHFFFTIRGLFIW